MPWEIITLRRLSNHQIMVGGAILAQGCLFLSIPFILRWYNANQVADWSLLITWVNLLWAFCQLKTDQALVQTEKLSERKQLYFLGLASNCILGGLILILGYQIGWIPDAIGTIWTFCALLLHGWHQMNLSWLLSKHQFRTLTFLRLLQSILCYPAALLFFKVLGTNALLLCFCASNAISGIVAIVFHWSPRYQHFYWMQQGRLLFQVHRTTFTYLALGNMVISVADQTMVILVGQFFSPFVAAAYFMAARICSLPISLVNTALSQYNLRYFQDLKLQSLFKPNIPIRFWLKWMPSSALYYLPILFFGSTLFGWILGPDWKYSGQIGSFLALAAWIRFLSNPTSMGFFVMGQTIVFFRFSLLMSIPMFVCFLLATAHWPLDAILKISVTLQIGILALYNILMLRMMQRN